MLAAVVPSYCLGGNCCLLAFGLLITLSEKIIVTCLRGGTLYKATIRSDSLESVIGIFEFLCCSSTILLVVSLFLLLYTLSRS